MARKQIKLTDIAGELNVSVSLVSLVLSGKSRENRISHVLSEKVISKAREMGYQTNQLARGLRTGKSGIIGLIVADIANPFFGEMARFIENEASKIGYHVMFGSSDEDHEKLNELIKVFLSRQVDAMVVVPVRDCMEQLKELLNQPIPVVFIDRYCEGLNADVFCADNFDGGYQLTKHLVSRGYNKIAAFTLDNHLTNNIDRIRGYRAALIDTGIEPDEKLINIFGYQEQDKKLKAALESALEMGCNALFFANNSIGINSMKYLSDLKLDIPGDIAMVSFDNPEAFHVSKPGITCYQQPMEKICTGTLDLISRRLNNNEYADPNITMYKGEMILRNSC